MTTQATLRRRGTMMFFVSQCPIFGTKRWVGGDRLVGMSDGQKVQVDWRTHKSGWKLLGVRDDS